MKSLHISCTTLIIINIYTLNQYVYHTANIDHTALRQLSIQIPHFTYLCQNKPTAVPTSYYFNICVRNKYLLT